MVDPTVAVDLLFEDGLGLGFLEFGREVFGIADEGVGSTASVGQVEVLVFDLVARASPVRSCSVSVPSRPGAG